MLVEAGSATHSTAAAATAASAAEPPSRSAAAPASAASGWLVATMPVSARTVPSGAARPVTAAIVLRAVRRVAAGGSSIRTTWPNSGHASLSHSHVLSGPARPSVVG